MATLPDPTATLTGANRELFEHMASARAHAEGRTHLGEVYVRMFNNPGVTAKVGALGEHLRFHGVLPDAVQQRFVAVHGNPGIVELVALCGLYAIMGHMVAAFDIEIEEGLPAPPF